MSQENPTPTPPASGKRPRAGKVYFIGAGPGDPGLLTLRGAELIRRATIVFHDRLVGDEVLDMIEPQTRRVDVGKGPTAGGKAQEDINERLVEAALEGHVVVRLKGGDSFIFGRGGEEALCLREAGVDFEVVPGITSAIAGPAYAGIPATHRGVATSFAVATGHGKNDTEADVDWAALAKGVDTLAVLMGIGRIAETSRKLIEGGKAPDTPVALIRKATLPDQEVLVSTLSEVADDVEKTQFKPPAIFLIGQVVHLRERLAWREKKPLSGLRVAVTRPAGQAEELNRLLRAEGATLLRCPTIEIEPIFESSELDRAVMGISGYDWLILTSVNGVHYFMAALAQRGHDARALAGVKLAVIGSKTGEALIEWGLRPDLTPGVYTQEGVLDAVDQVEGKKILLARASVARETLPDVLREKGAQVNVVSLYHTRPYIEGIDRLKKKIADRAVDVITFPSASTVEYLMKALDDDHIAALKDVGLASIGPSTSKAIENYGLQPTVQASIYTARGLFDAIRAEWAKR